MPVFFARQRMLVLLCVLTLIATACGGGTSDDAVEPVATEVPSATVVPPTATPVPEPTATEVPATATAVPPTETPVPTATEVPELDDETVIRQVHTRFMTELFTRDERVDGRGSHFDLLDELTVDPQNQRSRDAVDTLEGRGILVVSEGFDSNISEVEIVGDRATVFDCSKDGSVGWTEDGTLEVPADDFWKWRNVKLVKIDGVWFVEDFISGGDNRCDPETFADL